jgi:hypothetical protein
VPTRAKVIKSEHRTCILHVEELDDGRVILTLSRNVSRFGLAQFLKVLIPSSGGGNLVLRATKAVYELGEGDADAYFEAHGMSDNQAFYARTWS